MSLFKRQITKEDCDIWKQNKNINPLTKRQISTDNQIYKNLVKICISNQESNVKKDVVITEKECALWKQNKNINPFTNRHISETNPLYKRFAKECNDKKEEKINVNNELEDCLKWDKNKLKNPKTNYTIEENGITYKKIKKNCEPILKKYYETNQKISSISSSKSSLLSSSKSSISSSKSLKKDKDTPPTDNFLLHYPELDDEKFREKLNGLKEFNIHKILPLNKINNIEDFNYYTNKFCGIFDKALYQYLMAQYISFRTPYKSILTYHSVGVGKTCSAITIAEGFLIPHSMYDEPKIWVIMPLALKNSFKEQIFNILKIMDYNNICNQCTGDTYVKLLQILNDSNPDKINQKLKKLIKSRYMLFTYDGFVNFIENEYTSKNLIVKDKVIIIDEAHNIRLGGNENEKKIYTTMNNVLKNGVNNRLILLTATPMYNEPTDIYDLLYLLLVNDKREYLLKQPFPKIFDDDNNINNNVKKLLEKLSSNYISYLRGKNPFSFAFKLKPQDSNIKVLNKVILNSVNGNPIPESDLNWLDRINDGIVISDLGEKQKKYIKNEELVNDDTKIFNALQKMNIVYDDTIGERGFNTFFNRISTTSTNDSIVVNYNKKYTNALFPDENNLAKYSGKLFKIANIIKKSKGLVVIYSRYIWSGILPMAIILEHLGYNRVGSSNFLEKPKLVENSVKSSNYCILSSENPEIMGNSTIDNLIKIINSPMNNDCSQIKIILMTPVAGEGLNFYNVREMHLLESWYHFNRVDQIIGRGIRNCSHKNLPIEERNVTVFMHASIDGYEKETADIHAFRIASKKLNQSFLIDEIIRDNAIDCYLMKNINYFPKELFTMKTIKLKTSQDVSINYELGDDIKYEPKCNYKIDKIDDRGYRLDTYNHLAINIKNKLKNLILNEIHNSKYFIKYNEIKSYFNDTDIAIIMEAIKQSIYPNTLIDGYILIPHEDGIHIIKIETNIPLKIRIIEQNEEPIKETEVSNTIIPDLIKSINIYKDNINKAIIALYSSIDNITLETLCKDIITKKILNETDEFLATCLYREGILISKKELTSINTTNTNKYIGYINIFSEKFDPIYYTNDSKWRDLNDKQQAELKTVRRIVEIPNMTKEKVAWGLFIPIIIDKIKKNVFKLLIAGVSVGKKTGIVCTSLKKSDHQEIFKSLNLKDENNTKVSYCIKIANELLSINRISLLPEYKPTIPA